MLINFKPNNPESKLNLPDTVKDSKKTSLQIMLQVDELLKKATTIQETYEIRNLAMTIVDWSYRKNLGKEAVMYARSYVYRAERKLGEMLKKMDKATGAMGTGKNQYNKKEVRYPQVTAPKPRTLAELGIPKKESSRAQFLASVPSYQFEELAQGDITFTELKEKVKKEKTLNTLNDPDVKAIKKLKKQYDVIVINPNWPSKNTEDKEKFIEKISKMEIPHADDCHLFLWVSQPFLPIAFRLLDKWEAEYVFTIVWHKTTTAIKSKKMPRMNAEFCLYARYGMPVLINTDFSLCFTSPRQLHNEKPDKFYEIIRTATAGRRLNLFTNRDICGFANTTNGVF